ncbi:MAG: vancomycin resistance histidine kinase VanS [Oscillospiraceae bacterium]|jgi:two-component system sensor histidine kinase VanS
MFTWYDTNQLYWILQGVKDNILFFIGLIVLIGWTLITYHFISKPLRYLDEIIDAAKQLANPSLNPITLPRAMAETENELNLVRERALNDARAAKEAEQRKNDLIVYLAHDLKTPLTSVIGYLTLLRDEPQISQELRAKYMGIALDKAERLEDLINEFFDITRFNLSTLTLEPERRNLSRMLEQITSEFYPILAEKELRWHTEIAPDIEILCDPDKLERVFDNLIRNAVNYSYPQTEIVLTMEQTGDLVKIFIQNRGKTISPDKLSRIFEQFFRLDSSRSSSTGGAGLGLAISKEIVELHGGLIQAESADESVSFTVLLPVDCQKIV